MIGAARTVNFYGDALCVPTDAFEFAGFRRWIGSSDFPERARGTLAEGEVFLDMSPESIEAHNKVKSSLTADLQTIVRAESLGEFYCDGALLTHVQAQLSTEPDGMFASWDTLESGRLELSPRADGDPDGIELVGTPDIVIEVVSRSSVRKDNVVLRSAYAKAGVPEYWLVDARGDELAFQILWLDSGAYAVATASSATQRSRVLARDFVLERERNRVGRWSYRLRAVS
jgi:Uma2 family endonuclease